MCLEPRTPIAADASDENLVGEVVADLSAALVNTRIYAADHPRVRGSVESVADCVRSLPADGDGRSLRLATTGDLLVYGDRPLLGASMSASRLIQSLAAWSSGGIEIDATVRTPELVAFLRELVARPGLGEDWNQVNRRLGEAGIRSARLLPPFVESDGVQRLRSQSAVSTPLRFYQSCMDLLQDVTVSVCHGGRFDFDPVHAQVEAVLRQLSSGGGPLMNLARHELYDAFTFGHSVRVGVLAMTFARSLTTDHDLLVRIGTAALLHDCGKALVPFEILHARRPLDDDERREIGKHSQYGAEILIDHEDVDPMAIAAAFGHHRSSDGGGSPATLHEHRNLLVTEVVKICDVYEALTAARPYKQPMPPIRAYRVMVGMRAHLDRALLGHFIKVIGIHPVGQIVALSTGEAARVVDQTDVLTRPRVQILTDTGGEPLDEPARRIVDLTTADDRHGEILGAVEPVAAAALTAAVA